MIFTLVIVVVVAVLAVFFASYNQQMVEIILFGFPVQGTIGLFLVLSLGIGILLGILVMLPSLLKRSWWLNRQSKKIEELEQKPARKPSKRAPSKKKK